MPQPTRYARNKNFSGPPSALVLTDLNTEFDRIKETTDEICDNLELIQRDDGALHNAIVTVDSLAPDVLLRIDTAVRGADGSTLLTDTVDPLSPQGHDGDYWLNIVSCDLFGPKTAGAWGSAIANIRGVPGQDGEDGDGSGGGGAVDSVNGQTGAVVLGKSDVGLSAVDNTSDAGKPVSTLQAAADALVASDAASALSTAIAGLTKVSVGLSNVDNTSDANKPVSTLQAAADALAIPLTQKGANNGVATLDGSGFIPSSQIPPVAITEAFAVASQSAMLALVAQKGDVAIRSDLNKSFILATNSPGTLADWWELMTPTDAVLSVSGKTGTVSLVKGDVGLGNVDNTTDAGKPVSTAQAAADTAAIASAASAAAALYQTLSAKDASGGYVGLNAWKINFRNAANTFTSFLVNACTAARTYTFPNRDITVAGVDDIPTLAAGSDIRTGTDNAKFLTSKSLYDAAAPVTLTYASTYTPNLTTFLNGELTLTGNVILANPSAGLTPGAEFTITMIQDGTGSRLLSSVGSYYKFAGGAKTLSTAAGAVDVIHGKVITATLIRCELVAGYA